MSEEIRESIHQILAPNTVLRYSIKYVPAYRAYVLTIVTPKQGLSSRILRMLIDNLESKGYHVTVKGGMSLMYNVVRLIIRK